MLTASSCQKHTLAYYSALIPNRPHLLTDARKTWGFGLCFLHLRNVKGHPWNHKRVYRIYCELRLNLRIKPRKRLKRDKPDTLAVPEAPNMTWSMDFMADRVDFHPEVTRVFHLELTRLKVMFCGLCLGQDVGGLPFCFCYC